MKKKHVLYPLALLFIAMIAGCEEEVQKPTHENIYVNQAKLDLFVGESVQLTASPTNETFTWSSDNTGVATVTAKGLVEAVGEGVANIIVKSGELSKEIPINAITRIPLEDVIFSENEIELFIGFKKTIQVTYVPENVNDLPDSYSWSSEDPSIATVDPFGEIRAVGEGITYIVYKIGDIKKRLKVDAAITRPFKGPHLLSASAPYLLMAADFDFGGEGNAYHDNDATDRSGQNGNYRKSNGDEYGTGVDIEGFGTSIGYTNPGEWMIYTVEVQDAGNYLVEAQVAVPGSGSFRIEVDGVNVTGTIGVPDTGGWGAFTWVSTPADKLTINFTKGKHRIKYYIEGGHNFKALRFTKQ